MLRQIKDLTTEERDRLAYLAMVMVVGWRDRYAEPLFDDAMNSLMFEAELIADDNPDEVKMKFILLETING